MRTKDELVTETKKKIQTLIDEFEYKTGINFNESNT